MTAYKASRWNETYAAGTWDFLSGIGEASRYAVLAGYIRNYAQQGKVLDAGCGQGVLARYLDSSLIRGYTGFDWSDKAISKTVNIPYANFLQSSIEDFDTEDRFDVIVFNEVLYYLDHPLQAIHRYSGMLFPHGVLLMSMFDHRNDFEKYVLVKGIWESIKKSNIHILDETRLTNISAGLTWTVLAARPERFS